MCLPQHVICFKDHLVNVSSASKEETPLCVKEMVLPAFINSHVHAYFSKARCLQSSLFFYSTIESASAEVQRILWLPLEQRGLGNEIALALSLSLKRHLENEGRQSLVVNIFWFFQKSSRRLSCWCQLTLRSRPLQKGTAASPAWTINREHFFLANFADCVDVIACFPL